MQARFKAVKVLHDSVQELDEEMDRDKRLLEIAFEEKYQSVYSRRQEIVSGRVTKMDDSLVKAFDARQKMVEGLTWLKPVGDLPPVDVKDVPGVD